MKSSTIWGYWLVTDIAIATGLLYWPPALYISMFIVGVHAFHFWVRSPHVTSFPMQVRIGFLALLVLGQFNYLGWINWVQLAGVTALLTVDYCPLARLLSLMPWNRSEPLNWKFFKAALFTKPVAGSIIEVVSPSMVNQLHPEAR